MRSFILLFVALFFSGMAVSQTRNDSLPDFVKWIQKQEHCISKINQKHNTFDVVVQIRKTFDGAKEEAKPASIAWNNDYENKQLYSITDIGIKVVELPIFTKATNINLIFYPKLEFHENNIPDNDKKKNTLAAGINTEFQWRIGSAWYTHPFITGSFDYKDDRIKDIETIQSKGLFSFSGSKSWEPGGQKKDKTDALIFRYYPYSGIEYYQTTKETGQRAAIWASRLFFELYPLSKYKYQYVQLTFDYSYRSIINDNLYDKGNMDWLAVALNFYPDGNGKLGVGLEYTQGEDPTSNFVKTKMLALGIKLKI